ncbi:MAG TPA: DUF4197 domain-containing protein [Parasegetibacter sp.]
MKRMLFLLFIAIGFTRCDTAQQILSSAGYPGGELSNQEIISGLKEALSVGAANSGNKLSAVDGFFKNAALKILLPEEARQVEGTLRNLGLGSLVDNAILSMNRAAEDAASAAVPIFKSAIQQMTIQDAVGILRGGDFAATNYLKEKTTVALTNAFKPVIEKSLEKVNATRYWSDVFTNYNRFATKKINPDLSGYVTEKALQGIFTQLANEEQQIRQNPLARTTEILKKVFGSKLASGS